jgi:hypothetical protein
MTTRSTQRILRGLMRSYTAHAGTWLLVIGYLQGQDKQITAWFGPDAMSNIMMVFGLLVILLRAKTNESLEARGR